MDLGPDGRLTWIEAGNLRGSRFGCAAYAYLGKVQGSLRGCGAHVYLGRAEGDLGPDGRLTCI